MPFAHVDLAHTLGVHAPKCQATIAEYDGSMGWFIAVASTWRVQTANVDACRCGDDKVLVFGYIHVEHFDHTFASQRGNSGHDPLGGCHHAGFHESTFVTRVIELKHSKRLTVTNMVLGHALCGLCTGLCTGHAAGVVAGSQE